MCLRMCNYRLRNCRAIHTRNTYELSRKRHESLGSYQEIWFTLRKAGYQALFSPNVIAFRIIVTCVQGCSWQGLTNTKWPALFLVGGKCHMMLHFNQLVTHPFWSQVNERSSAHYADFSRGGNQSSLTSLVHIGSRDDTLRNVCLVRFRGLPCNKLSWVTLDQNLSMLSSTRWEWLA